MPPAPRSTYARTRPSALKPGVENSPGLPAASRPSRQVDATLSRLTPACATTRTMPGPMEVEEWRCPRDHPRRRHVRAHGEDAHLDGDLGVAARTRHRLRPRGSLRCCTEQGCRCCLGVLAAGSGDDDGAPGVPRGASRRPTRSPAVGRPRPLHAGVPPPVKSTTGSDPSARTSEPPARPTIATPSQVVQPIAAASRQHPLGAARELTPPRPLRRSRQRDGTRTTPDRARIC